MKYFFVFHTKKTIYIKKIKLIMDKKEIREKIATDLLVSGWLHDQAKKIIRNNEQLSNDLVAEILIIILTFKPVSKIYIANQKKQIKPFIKRIMLNQYNSTTSPFYIKYRKFQAVEWIENVDGVNDCFYYDAYNNI